METVFQRFMKELSKRQELTSVEALLRDTLSLYGFRTFAYLTSTPGDDADQIFAFGTYPDAWARRYCDNRYDLVDPVIARSVATTLPFRWSIDDVGADLAKPQRRFFDEADEHGLRYGFTIPIHDRRNKVATLTVATDRRSAEFEDGIEAFRHELHLIAIHLHARLRRGLLPGDQDARPLLTKREIACIQWVAWGKSATDIADILSIRPRTVVFHLENAKRKFGVATLPQAVVKAVTHDLICT